MGEKKIQATEGDKCGQTGTCMNTELTSICPSGYQEWTSGSCSGAFEKCCIKTATSCSKEGSYCAPTEDGGDGICTNGVCTKPEGRCGNEYKGTCQVSSTDGSNCPEDWDSYDGSCSTGYSCCIEAETSSCGTNGGNCKDTCDNTAGEKEDSTSPQCTNSQKCCYTKYTADDGTTDKNFDYDNPLKAETFTAWAETVLTSIQSIVGWLAVIMLMIGGIVYLTSAGTNQATLGKDIITAALIGFAVVIAGPSLLKEIKDIASTSGSSSSSAIDSAKDIKSIITSVLEFLLASMGTLALIGFAVGGVFYLTAFGDKSKAETGKKMAINSLYAIALAGGGLILVNQILSLLGS